MSQSKSISEQSLPIKKVEMDYYAFGMPIPGRNYYSEKYRFGFNGKEMDNEVTKQTGVTYDYGFRIYDARIAKFLSVDPLTKKYPELTPYQFASNTPIMAIHLDGLEAAYYSSIEQFKQIVSKEEAIGLASDPYVTTAYNSGKTIVLEINNSKTITRKIINQGKSDIQAFIVSKSIDDKVSTYSHSVQNINEKFRKSGHDLIPIRKGSFDTGPMTFQVLSYRISFNTNTSNFSDKELSSIENNFANLISNMGEKGILTINPNGNFKAETSENTILSNGITAGKLLENRANKIKSELINRGISEDRINIGKSNMHAGTTNTDFTIEE